MASILDLVKHFQHVIEKYPHDEHKVLKSIDKLYNLGVTVQHLQETGVGRTVNALRKEPGDIGNAAKALVNKWKLMVASEESSDPEDHEAPKYNGHGNGRDTDDDRHRQSRQSNGLNGSSSMPFNQSYQHTNGDLNSGKRRGLGNEQEPSSKKPRRLDDLPTDNLNVKRERYSDSDNKISETHTDDSDCSTLSSDKELKLKHEILALSQSMEYNEPSTSKQSEYIKKEETNSKKSHENKTNSDTHQNHKSSSKHEKTSSSHKHKDSKEKEKSLSNKLSSTDKHRNSSSKEERPSEKSRSHLEKGDSKDSSHKHKSDKDKHKSSSDKKCRDKHSDEHTSKEGSSSRRSHSSSKEKSHHKDTSKHLSSSKSSDSKEKSEKSGESKDSKKSSSSRKSSKSKDGEPKKKSQTTSEDSEEGVDCQSGASFAEALGMVSPAKSKKKSKSSFKEFSSPSTSFNDDLGPAAMLAPTAKLAPLPPLEIMALPEISPNYKPRPPPKLLPHFSDEEAISAGISSKNQRTKVYSGNKVYGKLPTLYDMCVQILQEHIDALEYTGGVPYDILKPVIDKATPSQLFLLEHYNPYLIEDTNHLWQKFCEKTFRGKKRQEMETWRELYLRAQEEQEVKLRSLTENIKIAQEAKKAPIKQTKMAYVDSVVKPPRNIARKQAVHGTARTVSASPAARVAALASSSNVRRAGAVRPVIAPSSAMAALRPDRPRKAPLMQKALQLMRGGRKK